MKAGLFTYTRGSVAVYRLCPPAKCIHQRATEVNGIKCNISIQGNEEDKIHWSWSEEEIKNLGEKIWEETKTESGKQQHFQKIREVSHKTIQATKEIRKLDLTLFSDQELVERHQQFFLDFRDGHALTGLDVDAIDIVPVELLKELLAQQLSNLNKKDFLEVEAKLLTPIFTSYVSAEEKAMLKLLIQVKDNKIPLLEIKNLPEFKQIINKFWWTCLGWENVKLKTEQDYLKDLQHYQETVPDPQKRIAEIETANQKKQVEREQLIRKYSLSEEIQSRLKFFDQYAVIHDLRKEMQMRILYSDDLFLQEFVKRIQIPTKKLEWYWHEEIHDFLLGKNSFSEENYLQRKQAYFRSNETGKTIFLIGEEAKRKIAQYYDQDLGKIKEIKGVCSSPGFARGKVKVCSGYEEALAKIEPGDILVTGMTLPDYVPAMRKAAAIVTDEGGITCHAAIVSRELGKPCLTSTKIASEALKDDDLVEVDANQGVVKKI